MITAADINRMNSEYWARPEPHLVQLGLAFKETQRIERMHATAKSVTSRRDKTRERDERIIASPLTAKQIAAAERLTISQVYRIRKR